MSLPDESAPRRPVLVPVIIAAVFLTIIGASVGLALGARSQNRTDAGPTTGPVVVPTSAPVQAPPDLPSDPPADPPADPSADEPSQEPGDPACRDETQAAGAEAGAAGRLTVVAHRIYSKSDVWICADENGALYYHANRASGNGEWIEGETALFLTGVEQRGQTFVARNPTDDGDFVFEARPKELRIAHPRSEVEVQPLRG